MTEETSTPLVAALWSEESFQQAVELLGLNESQKEKLWQLNEQLKDVDYFLNCPLEVARFLIGKDDHVKQAEDAFRKMIVWRKENQVDTILQDYQPPAELPQYFPMGLLPGLDHRGGPILLSRMGESDPTLLLQRYGRQGAQRFVTYLRESLVRGPMAQEYQKHWGHPFAFATLVEDLHGLSLKHRNAMSQFHDMMNLIQNMYPAVVNRVILVRAPTLFRILIWPLAKHFLDPFAARILTFTTPHNYQQILSQHLDIALMPGDICPNGGQGHLITDLSFRPEADFFQRKSTTSSSTSASNSNTEEETSAAK